MSSAGAPDYPQHRPNVGIVLVNAKGEVWYGRRHGASGDWRWQFPQGGIDAGEDPADAALRELWEETGVTADKVEPLGRIPGWLAYDYPPELAAHHPHGKKAWKGQKQAWFAFRYLGEDGDFDLEAHGEVEFDAWRWAPLSDAPGVIIPWKRPVYEQVAAHFADIARV